jgi:hypothetical protein
MFKNIRRSKLYKFAENVAVFPYIEVISCIMKYVDMETIFIVNSKGHPITYFQASIIASRYHLEDEERSFDKKLIKKKLHNVRELLKVSYKPSKVFKSRSSNEYPTNMPRIPYQYAVVVLCKMYEEPNAQNFIMTWVPLLYYVVDAESTFNWADILSLTLEEALTVENNITLGEFSTFHMSSYLLDVMSTYHSFPQMGWAWQPSDPSIHIYCKIMGA